jgi:beta-galactosidase
MDCFVKGSLLTHILYSLPVPSLWIDVFQKVKALGFNCVSFYVDWNLLEGKPGQYSAEGIFALEPFFDAAKEAGIYLLARPGPYINAEASGGGFPGWLQRVNGTLRTSDEAYLKSTDKYVIVHDTELKDDIERLTSV